MKKINWGPFLIMFAASLWALDALIRTNLTQTIPAGSIVFFEHIVGFIILLPFFIKGIPNFKKLNIKDWEVLLLLTIFSSVLGTLFFTEAINLASVSFDFVTPTLLQKLQPLFVVFVSWIVLSEKVNIKFIGLGIIAIIGSYFVTFGSSEINLTLQGKEMVYLLSLGAAAMWGTGTVLSKKVLNKLSFSDATSLRFALAIPISFIVMQLIGHQYNITDITGSQFLRFIIIALSTGAAAILIYYKGLKTTKASVGTFAELTFPIISLIIAITPLNPYGEPQTLLLSNIFGIIILVISILIISLEHNKNEYPKNN